MHVEQRPVPGSDAWWYACMGGGQLRDNPTLFKNRTQDTNWLEAGLMFQAGGNSQGLVHLPTQEHRCLRGMLSPTSKDPGTD